MADITFSDEIERRLDTLAEATGRSKASHVEEAVVEYLGDIEDLHIAERELARIDSGESTLVSLDHVMKQYGLED